MIPLQSTLERTKESFTTLKEYFEPFQFVLGGNWDYDHGYFDRALDEEQKVWLRIPFQVTAGQLDGEAEDTDAVIELGTPFVLKHLYQEGLDQEVWSAGLVNQFQTPADKDAEVAEQWVQQARDILTKVERKLI